MATNEELLFELQRRVVLFRSGTVMPDGSSLGYDGDPNLAVAGVTLGQTLIVNSPIGTRYQEDNGTQWYKESSPNNWEKFGAGVSVEQSQDIAIELILALG